MSGLDDFIITLACLWPSRERFRWPATPEMDDLPERPIAVLVPLWHEDGVIEQMLKRNLSVIRYGRYDVFVGVYPNDKPTLRAVRRVARRHARVHMAINPRNGPSSKGDCLNNAYRAMREHEAAQGIRYEIVMMHDAEDLIHADSLKLVNWFSRDYQMVQVPVLPLPTSAREFTHGIYCDEFAESQAKDIPVRQLLGAFLPSSGVGTGFDRAALERLAEQRQGRVFEPKCLTEDYDTGYLLHAMGCRQIFLPVRFDNSGPIATREYFPRRFRAAVRQRSRWVAGIALQGWERHGWGGDFRRAYWFWRDRKGLIGNLLSPVANLSCLYGFLSWLYSAGSGQPWHFGALVGSALPGLCVSTFSIAVVQTSARGVSCARIYGWRFAAGVPLRTLWANAINCAATAAALNQFIGGRMRKQALVWRKTEHVYPTQPIPGYSPARFSEQG